MLPNYFFMMSAVGFFVSVDIKLTAERGRGSSGLRMS